MSLILDALKKLDREKSSRRIGTANIAVKILRPALPHPRKRIRLYFAAVCLTAVAIAAVTYGVIVEFGFLPKSSPPVPLNAPAPSQQVATALHSPEPVRDARDEISQIPPKIQIPAESKIPAEIKNPATSLGEEKATRNVMSKEADVAPQNTKKTPERTPKAPATTPPSLTLSAIAWSEEPSKRLALINDTITTEGSEIQGVKVVEIDPHRVRFSYNGQAFEISLSQ